MPSNNEANAPQNYWAWTDATEVPLVSLGVCADFEEADEKAPGNTHWIFTRKGLVEFLADAGKALGAARTAQEMRTEAAALLAQAQELDGLRPNIVIYEFEAGSSAYLCWARGAISEKSAASGLQVKFEPDRGETLIIETKVSLGELTGAAKSSRIDVVDESAVEAASI